ncbi:MAG: NAD(P)(+) transhydrogenase (Re/Si-specific) subunit beta [Saprospiraceae bacterium]|nr:NAD(P)(+) transhydrogenase (Re/Si-specific) subunit beta [Saprospiraceae bacterium]MCB0572990.1 NAD(P)(+) transhydrogenase (Re/Si-specific) subunit beta [Saprospiraceae bacterium]MCB9307221.1 NAD(P)(+) transhydrogenase (Re/Si-specific) subunit beta [Lewinellaceae bacterium]MCB9354601.1 NAD(P)(+) transhydrogenase (Re/Si-specific) subunit beta [Lewinellaceae bacterium]
MEQLNTLINIVYILSAVTFILGFKLMSNPISARRGNLISAVGMGAAIIVTLMDTHVERYEFILMGMVVGTLIGLLFAFRTPMTGMPQMVGLLNGFGGTASLLVAWAEFHAHPAGQGIFGGIVLWLTAIIGSVTFSGSLIAWAKLEEKFISGKPVMYTGQQFVTGAVLVGILGAGIMFALDTVAPEAYRYFALFSVLALILGVLLVIPIGGADMPVVICLLNSYSGMAACASGFIVQNNLLIVAGALVGASGIILTLIMCKAMNRSVANVFLGGFGAPVSGSGVDVVGELKEVKADDAYLMLEAANRVVIVPGYGMAVSQAQHAVRELTEALEKNGAEVSFAIHPVAGRMPGHMNVLLAEANISYDAMVEMDAINPTMETVDICMIIGANDVVNPAAQEDKTSPLWGMPIIEANRARTVIVMKRGKGKGFAGVENLLFYRNNCRMLYGDAKGSLQALIGEFKSAAGS